MFPHYRNMPHQSINPFIKISDNINNEVKLLKQHNQRYTNSSGMILRDLRSVPNRHLINPVCLSKISNIIPFMGSIADRQALLEFLTNSNWDHQNAISIGSLMHKLGCFSTVGEQRIIRTELCVNHILLRLSRIIPAVTDFKAQNIGNALYGLKNLADSEAVQAVLSALAKKIPAVTNFDAQNIGNALYGLKNLEDSKAVQAVLSALATKIPAVTGLDSQAISNALYGLQNLADSNAVQAVLSALATKIPAVTGFKAQEIGNAFYGLKNLTDSNAVQAVLSALAAKIRTVTNLDSQAIGNALYGLQNIEDSKAVQVVLSALATKIPAVTGFKAQEIGNALYGLKNLTDSNAVQAVLSALATKIPAVTDFNAQAIGNAFYGLKNLEDSEAVQAVLSALATKIPAVTGFNGQEIGNALYGLKNLTDSNAVQAVLSALATKIPAVTDFNAQAIGNALHGMQNIRDKTVLVNILESFKIALKINANELTAKKVIYHHFRCLMLQKDLLGIKLAFITEIIQKTEPDPWLALARSLKISDYLALINWDKKDQTSETTRLINLVENSNDQKLIQLRTAACPEKIDEEVGFTPEAYQALLSRDVMSQEEQLQNLTQTQASEIDLSQKRKAIHAVYQKITLVQSISSLTLNCIDIVDVKSYPLKQSGVPANTRVDLIILLPTVGTAPDVSTIEFVQALDASLSQAKKWDKTNSVKVILGINGPNKERAQKAIGKTDSVLSKIKTNNNIIIERHGFEWTVKGSDHSRKIIPFGTIRNHCFNKALPSIQEGARFISMDGDTTLTAQSIDRVFNLEENQFTTIGYQLPIAHKNEAKNLATTEAFDLHWKLQSKACDKEISLGYPAEPCLIVGSGGLKALKELHGENKRIYGSTDCEGRFLVRHLISKGNQFLQIDSSKVELHNFARFQVSPKLINDRKTFIAWLSSMAGQSQNMSNLDFFTRQLGFALSISDKAVRDVAKRLYVPKLLKEGYTLKDIQIMLAALKKPENKVTAEEKASFACIKPFLVAKKHIEKSYGAEIVDVVSKNCIEWADVIVSFAIQKLVKLKNPTLMSLIKASPALVSPQAVAGATELTLSGNRTSKASRESYPILNRKRSYPEGTLTSSSKRSKLDVVRQPSAMDIQPKGYQNYPNSIENNQSREVSANPLLTMKAMVDRGISKLPSAMKDLLTLLEPSDFGEQGSLTQKGIDQLFRRYVIDYAKSANIEAVRITPELVADTIRDLIVARYS